MDVGRRMPVWLGLVMITVTTQACDGPRSGGRKLPKRKNGEKECGVPGPRTFEFSSGSALEWVVLKNFVTPVSGEIPVSGRLQLRGGALAKVSLEASMDTARLKTGIQLRDVRLQDHIFRHSGTIKFTLKSLQSKNDVERLPARGDSIGATAKGLLNFGGRRIKVAFPLTLERTEKAFLARTSPDGFALDLYEDLGLKEDIDSLLSVCGIDLEEFVSIRFAFSFPAPCH